MKRKLAWLLSAAMVMSSIPTNVFAEEINTEIAMYSEDIEADLDVEDESEDVIDGDVVIDDAQDGEEEIILGNEEEVAPIIVPETETIMETEPETAENDDVEYESESEDEEVSEEESEIEIDTEAVSETESETAADVETESENESETESEIESETESESDLELESEIQDEAEILPSVNLKNAWYEAENGEKVFLTGEREQTNTYDYSEMLLQQDTNIGFEVELLWNTDYENWPDEIVIGLEKEYLKELKSGEEATLHLSGLNGEELEVQTDVEWKDQEIRIRKPDTAEAEAGKQWVLSGIDVEGTLAIEELSVLENSDLGIYVNGIPTGMLRFPKAAIPYGIVQYGTQSDEEPALLAWAVGIEPASEGQEWSLADYTVVNGYDKENLELVKVTDYDGSNLDYTETDQGIEIQLSEEVKTPYYYEIYLRMKKDMQDGETHSFVNSVELSKENLVPCEDTVWSSDCELDADALYILSWEEYYALKAGEYGSGKDAYIAIYQSYLDYLKEAKEKEDLRREQRETDSEGNVTVKRATYAGSGSGSFENAYLQVAVSDDGRFTLGNVEGDPNYSTDDGKKLLYGHPSPGTSETRIIIDDMDFVFSADTVYVAADRAYAIMHVDEKNVTITENIEFVKSGSAEYEDAAKISYSVKNNGSSPVSVGIRIMLDTMIASNDSAPFRVAGHGNVTTIKAFYGSNIPEYYQVYDNLDSPTTKATGYLIVDNERRPDAVYFTNWGSIRGADWGYSPSVDSNLGDSAVAVVFNKAEVAPGKTSSVATRYGVGLGTGGNSASSVTLGADEIAFKVLNIATDSSVEGATVTIGNKTVTTDTNGRAIFKTAEANNKGISISKAEYVTRQIDPGTYENGHQYTIRIKKEGDQRPIITKVVMGNKDLLKETATYCEDVSSVLDKKENASRIHKVQIKVYADEKDCTYYLYQGSFHVATSDSGEFEFRTMTGNNGDAPYIDGFEAGKDVYVKCVSKATGASSKTQLSMRILSPKLAFSLGNLSKKTIGFFTGNEVSAGNLLLEILAGGKNTFKIGSTDKYSIEVEPDFDTPGVKIGINMKTDFLKKDNQEAFNTYFKTAKKVYNNKTPENEKKLNDAIKRWEKSKKNTYKVGQTSFDISVGGAADLRWKDNHFEGEVIFTITGNGSASTSWNFWVQAIPMYITIGAEGEISIEFFGPMNIENMDSFVGVLQELFNTYSIFGGIFGEIGAGHSDIAKIGGKLKAGYSEKGNFRSNYTSRSIEGTLSLEAKALFWSKSWELAKATWKLYDGPIFASGRQTLTNVRSTYDAVSPELEGSQAETEDFFEQLMDAPTEFEGREYQALKREVTTATMLSEAETDATISNAYTSASPYILTGQNCKYRFWLEDMGEREAQNRTALVFSYMIDDSWSAPVVIDDDGTADFNYSVTESGNEVYVAWQECNRVFGSNVDLREMGQGLDISLAKILMVNGEPQVSTYSISSNSVLDQMPATYALGSDIYIVWNSMESSFFEDVVGNRLNYCVVQNGVPGTTKSVALDNMSVENIQLNVIGGKLTAVYTMAKWDDILNSSTERTYYMTLADGTVKESNLTNLGSVPYMFDLDGESMLFWYQNQNICYRAAGNESTEVKTVFSEEDKPAGLNDAYVLVHGNHSDYLLWVAAKENDDADNILYAVEYNNGSWGLPYVMSNLGNGQVASLSAAKDPEGRISVSWQRLAYDSNDKLTASDLCYLTIEDYYDVVLEDVLFDEAGADVDETLMLTLKVTNKGNSTVNDLSVYVDGQQCAVQGVVSIPSGETKDICAEFVVPARDNREYEVRVETADENVWDNNSFHIRTGGVDPKLINHGYVYVENEEALLLEIVNDKNIDAENVRIRIMDGEEDGVVLYEQRFDTIGKKDSRFINVPKSVFGSALAANAYIYTDTEREQEITPILISVGYETFEILNSYRFVVTAETGGRIIGTYDPEYDETSEISLSAVPETGYVFWGWEADYGELADSFNAQTTYIMPSCDTEVKAVFKPYKAPTGLNVPQNITIHVGESTEIAATVLPADASEHINWESMDETVVTVDPAGMIYGAGTGTTTIKASCGQFSKECTVTVTDILISEIQMLDKMYLDGVNISQKLDVVTDPIDATEKIIWNSSNENVVVVDENGMVTSKGVGTAVITACAASDPAKAASCEVVVTSELERIEMQSSFVLNKGEETQLTYEVYPLGANSAFSSQWRVMDPSVVEISTSGANNEIATIRAVGIGSTLVEVTVGEFTAACLVEVVSHVESITFNPASLTLRRGEEKYLDAEIHPDDYMDTLEWSSDDSEIADVYDGGYVHGNRGGTTNIHLTSSNGISATCPVSVIEVPITSMRFDKTSLNLKAGESEYISLTYAPVDTTDDVDWESTDYDVADISGGTVRAVGAGTCTITATSTSGKKAICTVTVVPNITYVTGITGFESQHPYSNDMDQYWVYTKAGEHELEITFSDDTGTESGYDYIYIYDRNDREIASYTGEQLAGTTISVPGDTVKVRLRTDGSVTKNGFKVTAIRGIHTYVNNICSQCGGYQTVTTPKLTKVENAITGVKLTWGAVKDAKIYRIYRKTASTGWAKLTDVTSATTYTDTTAASGTTYLYTIRCVSADGKKFISSFDANGTSILSLKSIKPTVANAVTGVQVSWTKVTGATSYAVYRKSGTAGYARIATVNNGATVSYTDTTAVSGTTYTYAVRAINGTTMGSFTAVSVVYLKSVTPTLQNATGVQISWTKVTGATGYAVYRKSGTAGYVKIATISSGATVKYTDTKAVSGTTYTYAVRAVKGTTMGLFTAKSITYLSPITPVLSNVKAGVKISWTRVTGATSYAVYRKNGTAGYTRIATISNGTTVTYTDSKAVKGTTYTYAVRAIKGTTMGSFTAKSIKRS